jgi:hypothetical protein
MMLFVARELLVDGGASFKEKSYKTSYKLKTMRSAPADFFKEAQK